MNSVYNKVCEYINNYPGGIAWRLKKHSTVIEEHLNPEEEILFIFCGQKTLNCSKEINFWLHFYIYYTRYV